MKSNVFAVVIATGVLAAVPVMAQQSQQGQSQESKMLQNQKETVPLELKSKQIMEIQQKLNKQGFDAGNADGNWGPQTAEAVKNFQEKKGLQPTGTLDQKTLSELGIKMTSGSGGSSGGQQSQQKQQSQEKQQ